MPAVPVQSVRTMRRRGARGPWLDLSAAMLLAGCTQQFHAVTVTSQLGVELAQHREVVSGAGANCIAALAYHLDPRNDHCAQALSEDGQWRAVLLALVAYSQRLNELVSGQSRDGGASAAKLANAYGGAGVSGFGVNHGRPQQKALLDVVTQLTARGPGDSARLFVERVGPSADTLALLLRDHVRLQLSQLGIIRTALCAALERDNRQVVTADGNQHQFDIRASKADGLLHAQELGRLLREQRALQLALDDVQVFIRAHQALVRALQKPDYDDEQAAGNVLTAIMTSETRGDGAREVEDPCLVPQR